MITLFSTKCPKCLVLEAKLNQKQIEYEEINDVDEIIKLGYKSAPLLKVDDKIMLFKEALDWVNEQEAK